jgi:hypothetical protein
VLPEVVELRVQAADVTGSLSLGLSIEEESSLVNDRHSLPAMVGRRREERRGLMAGMHGARPERNNPEPQP